MSFKDSNTAKSALGNQLKTTPNTKGTGRRGVPTAIALESKDYRLASSSNPDPKGDRKSKARFDS